MIKPLRERRPSVLLELDRLLAEAAPEARLKVAAVAALGAALLLSLGVGNAVHLREVIREGLSTVADFGAGFGGVALELLVAAPELELDMLTVLVPLPVVLGAESLITVGVGASVRLLMPLAVFPIGDVNVAIR